MARTLLRLSRPLRKLARRLPSPATRLSAQHDEEPSFKPLEWPVIRRILTLMRPYRQRYLVTTLISMAICLMEMLAPQFMSHLIDRDIPSGSYQRIALTLAGWAMTMLSALLMQRFVIGFTCRTGEMVLRELRVAIFEHLQRLSMSFYDKTRFGRILSRGTSDIQAMASPLVWGTSTMMSNAMMMALAAGLMLWIDWRVALGVLWLGPVLYWINTVYGRRVGAAHRIVREGYTRVSTNLAENISGMRVVNAFNRQHQNLSVFNALQSDNTTNNTYSAFISGIFVPLMSVVGYVGKGLILGFGGLRVLRGELSLGSLIALFLYWDWFMGPVLNFGAFRNEMMQAMAGAERIFALLDQQPEVQDAPHARALEEIRGAVSFEKVTFGYDPKRVVLEGIDFRIEPGQSVALVGHTGCGKSTIISLLCRFYLPQSGRICLDGQDLREIQGESLHRQLGIVSQQNYLFAGTVLENIRYARPGASEQEVYQAAAALGCHERFSALQKGYQTPVGERGQALSLGERQLVCFTRAFLANPRLLMLDEATSAVDTQTEMLLQEAIEKLIAQRTTFMVAHRLSTVVRADLVLVLEKGRIIERGTHAQLLARQGVYAGLYAQFCGR